MSLLGAADPEVRAKVCNLFGNMCRHSGFFYDALLRHSAVGALIDRCGDDDHATRKFATYAVGNAAFYSDALYPSLRPCIPYLTELMSVRERDRLRRVNESGVVGVLDWVARVCTLLLCVCVCVCVCVCARARARAVNGCIYMVCCSFSCC